MEQDKYQRVNGTIVLSCGTHGGVISKVLFADFGTPSGDCSNVDPTKAAIGSLASNASCSSASTSVKGVENLCVGHPACRLALTNGVDDGLFDGGHDPCFKVPKRLGVAVACVGKSTSAGAASPAAPRAFEWNVTLPTGSAGHVVVPLLGADASAVTITVDGTHVVWKNGAFVEGSGAEGVRSGKVERDGVALSCGGGRYAINMLETVVVE